MNSFKTRFCHILKKNSLNKMDIDLAELLPAYYCIPVRCSSPNNFCKRICTHIFAMALAIIICFGGFYCEWFSSISSPHKVTSVHEIREILDYQNHYHQHNSSTPLWGEQNSFQEEEMPLRSGSFERRPPKISDKTYSEKFYEKFSEPGANACNEDYIKQLSKELQFLGQEVSNLQEWKQNLKEGLTTLIQKQSELMGENIDQALNIYSADEIGLMDYAAAYSGGSIEAISKDTHPFPTYRPWTLFKLIHFDVLSSPEEILKTSTLPGNCFAFQGCKAQIKIKLAGSMEIGSVTMDHASKLLLGVEGMNSAPKNFEVYGFLGNKKDKTEYFLGKFVYDIEGDQHQTFIIDENLTRNRAFSYVQLNILSNHGKAEFTCVYRFRVHGKPIDDESSSFKICPGCKKNKNDS